MEYERDGKQFGRLNLPHSVHRSALGVVQVPVAVIRNGDGPTALLMAGTHGDEYEGQITLCRLARELEPEDLRGRVIILPAVNLPAALAGTRQSPLDDGNLNRAFPGDRDGGPTAQIAYYLRTVLLPMTTVWCDLHSGGNSLSYLPFTNTHVSGANTPLDRERLEALKAFGSALGVVRAATMRERSTGGQSLLQDVIYLGGEYGGGGTVDRGGIRMTRDGVLRTLVHFGILENREKFQVSPPALTRLIEIDGRDRFVYATEPGLFEPLCELGDTVSRNQPAGLIHFVDNPVREAVAVTFNCGGLLVCKRASGRVERGDCVAHVAIDWPAPI